MSNRPDPSIGKIAVLCIIGLIVLLVSIVGLSAGCKEYNRYQARADRKNQTQLVKQDIKTAAQQAQVNRAQIAATKAEAEKRVAEAHGIRQAQDLIAKTLTPLYVQHEAIQAQKIQGAGDKLYVPVGPQGIPLVQDVGPGSSSALR